MDHRSGGAIIPADGQHLTVWQDNSGKPYLVKRQRDGAVAYIPLETALADVDRTAGRQDIWPLLMVGLMVLLGASIVAYALGFLAGSHGRETVVVPRSPICDTRRSGFLGFWSEQKDCR